MTPWRASVGVLVLVGGACASDPAAPDSRSNATAGDGGGAGKRGVSTASCPPGKNPESAIEPLPVGVVSGELIDERGEPTTAGLVQICGTDICRNADVRDNGTFAYVVDAEINVPACKFGDGFGWAKLAVPLRSGDSELGTLVTPRLPDYADGAALVPGQTVSSGGVSLELAAEAHIQHNIIDYESDAERVLRAVELPRAALDQLGQDFVVGFALSPLETRICPSPKLSLANSPELPPGTELELYLLGLDAGEEFVPYAQWQMVGEGRVSEDGESLEFPDGVPLLTAVGVKVKP